MEIAPLDFDLKQLEIRPPFRSIWLADPAYFDVEYVINPHMAPYVGAVDKQAALRQWQSLYDAYISLGFEVEVVPAVAGFPDFVFVANQSFAGRASDGEVTGVGARMFAERRRAEVSFVKDFYTRRGLRTVTLAGDSFFEGTGDALWYPGRRLIVGGYGFRTVRSSLEELSTYFDVPFVGLELVDPRFYHLDTCLSMLSEETAFYVDIAFSEEGKRVLKALIPNLIPLPIDEAVRGLACNGHCPDGKHYVVHGKNVQTIALARAEGFEVVPVDTTEFIKSGGSVYCMKLALP